MGREYNINEIEFEESDDKSKAELLTGEYLKGISKGNSLQPNTEVEVDEYVKFPDQTVVKAVGNPHEKGGIDVAIPDGTEVISDNLKPTKKQKKEIEKMFDITVSDSDTYAKLVAKFTKKIGLEKLNDDQAKTFEKLEMLTKNTSVPKATAEVNLEYLSSKIKQLEDKKKAVEPQRKSFFDYIYGLQQDSKSPSEKDNTFKYGGTQIQEIAKQFNIPQDAVKNFLEMGGKVLPQYAEGDPPTEEPKVKFTYNYLTNTFQPETEEYQKATSEGAYGTFGSRDRTLQGIQQLYNNFPDYVEENFKNYINIDKTGKVTFKENTTLKLNQKQDIVGKLQEGMGKRYEANYKVIMSDPTLTEAEKAQALKWYNEEGFTHNRPISVDLVGQGVADKLKAKGITTYGQLEAKLRTPEIKNILKAVPEDKQKTLEAYTVRNYDQKAGQFTLGRQSVAVDLVTPEDLKKLKENGITTVKQLEKNTELLNSLSDVSKNRIEAFKKQAVSGVPDADFFIEPIKTPGEKTPTTQEQKTQEQKTQGEEPKEKTKIGEEKPITDLVYKYLYQKPNVPRAFYTPDQTPLPPTPVQPVLKTDLNFGRIDPVRVGIETQLREVENQNRFVASQLEGMPETQKASALAMMMANSNESINKAATSANQINAQNISSAELFNIGQADKEAVYDRNSDTVFQNTMFAAQAKAEEQLRRFYDQMNKVNITNLQNNQKLNLIDSVFPDYSLDFSGSRVNFDPENPNAPLIRDSFLNRTLGVIGQ